MLILCVVIFNFSLRLEITYAYLNHLCSKLQAQILYLLKQLQNFWISPFKCTKTGIHSYNSSILCCNWLGWKKLGQIFVVLALMLIFLFSFKHIANTFHEVTTVKFFDISIFPSILSCKFVCNGLIHKQNWRNCQLHSLTTPQNKTLDTWRKEEQTQC